MKEPNLQSKILWNACGNLSYMMAQWVITVIVGRMDFEAAGVLSLAMSISATLQTVAMFGIHNYQVSDIDEKYANSTYVSFRVISCVVAFFSCVIFLLVRKSDAMQFTAVLLYMVFRLAESISDVFLAIAQRHDRIDVSGKAFFLKALGLLPLFLVGFLLTRNLCVGLLMMAIFSVASTFLFDIPAVGKLAAFRFWEHGSAKYKLALETLPLFFYLLFNTLISTLPKMLLESNTNQEVLGAYSSIYAPALLISAVAGYLYNPFVLHFANFYHDRNYKAFWSLLAKIIATIVVFSGITLCASSLLGEFALTILFGEKIKAYVYMLNPIVIAIFINSIFLLMGTLESVLHDFKGLLFGCGIGVAIELLTISHLIAYFGPNGASYSFAFASLAAGGIMLVRLICKLRCKSGSSN